MANGVLTDPAAVAVQPAPAPVQQQHLNPAALAAMLARQPGLLSAYTALQYQQGASPYAGQPGMMQFPPGMQFAQAGMQRFAQPGMAPQPQAGQAGQTQATQSAQQAAALLQQRQQFLQSSMQQQQYAQAAANLGFGNMQGVHPGMQQIIAAAQAAHARQQAQAAQTAGGVPPRASSTTGYANI